MKNTKKYMTLDKEKDRFMLIKFDIKDKTLHTERFIKNLTIMEAAFAVQELSKFSIKFSDGSLKLDES